MAATPETEPGLLPEEPGSETERGPLALAGREGPLLLFCDHGGSGWAQRAPRFAEGGFRIETTAALRQTLARLEQDPLPDPLLVDPLSSAGMVELSVLEERRQRRRILPVLVVVGADEESALLRVHRALGSGYWDLLRRDASERELELRARRLLDVAQDASEMEELRHRAFHDDRTDLLRPLAFQARMREHFSAAQRHKHDLAFVLIDLDRFGRINKDHDHMIGDALIAQVGDVIRRTLREEDVAGRLGGDEFAVLLPYTRKIDAARVVNRLREEIKTLSGRPGGARAHVEVSASIGFETFDGTDIESLETLRRHAERALRVSKTEGGDRAVYFRSLPAPDPDDVEPSS